MTVRAIYSDGSDRDVTKSGRLPDEQRRRRPLINDEWASSRPVSGGEAFVMARFGTFTVGSQMIVLPKGLEVRVPEPSPTPITSTRSSPPSSRSCGSCPSGICTDEVFLRRVYLDIVGLPPTVDEHDRFNASVEPDQAGGS